MPQFLKHKISLAVLLIVGVTTFVLADCSPADDGLNKLSGQWALSVEETKKMPDYVASPSADARLKPVMSTILEVDMDARIARIFLSGTVSTHPFTVKSTGKNRFICQDSSAGISFALRDENTLELTALNKTVVMKRIKN